jgi:hypothetical protein
MPDADLLQRIQRIYAAVQTAEEADLSRLPARVLRSGRFLSMYQDFSGSLRDEEIVNLAYSVIHNIANLCDHARRWAKRSGKDPAIIDEAVEASFALLVITDLSSNDKHGYPPRDGGRSRRSPKLVNTRRILRIATGAEKGSAVAVTFAPDGTPQVSGSGSAKAIVTGEVVDDKGVHIGDLYDLANRAVEDWARVLEQLGALP